MRYTGQQKISHFNTGPYMRHLFKDSNEICCLAKIETPLSLYSIAMCKQLDYTTNMPRIISRNFNLYTCYKYKDSLRSTFFPRKMSYNPLIRFRQSAKIRSKYKIYLIKLDMSLHIDFQYRRKRNKQPAVGFLQ